jgi:hypothetical protein
MSENLIDHLLPEELPANLLSKMDEAGMNFSEIHGFPDTIEKIKDLREGCICAMYAALREEVLKTFEVTKNG